MWGTRNGASLWRLRQGDDRQRSVQRGCTRWANVWYIVVGVLYTSAEERSGRSTSPLRRQRGVHGSLPRGPRMALAGRPAACQGDYMLEPCIDMRCSECCVGSSVFRDDLRVFAR
jgi:hypothetical protein